MSERLTERNANGTAKRRKAPKSSYVGTVYAEMAEIQTEILDRLCELEDKICEGKILELPCKVGDTLWKIEDVWHLDDRATWKYHYEKEILEFRVRSISISCNSKGIWTKKFRICEVKNGKTIDKQRNIEFDDYGKSVFLTPEEANKKLKELEGE